MHFSNQCLVFRVGFSVTKVEIQSEDPHFTLADDEFSNPLHSSFVAWFVDFSLTAVLLRLLLPRSHRSPDWLSVHPNDVQRQSCQSVLPPEIKDSRLILIPVQSCFKSTQVLNPPETQSGLSGV